MLGRKTGAGLVLAAMTVTGVGAVSADAEATAPREDRTAADGRHRGGGGQGQVVGYAGSSADRRPVMWTVPPPRRSGR